MPFTMPNLMLANLTLADLNTKLGAIMSWYRRSEKERGAANGIATLGSTALVPTAQLGTGAASSATVLFGNGTWGVAAGSGTVTSVALTAPAEITVAGSPIVGAGTLALTWANESANTVLAGPTTGAAVAPAFRALVAADIPALGTTPAVILGASAASGAATTYLRTNDTIAAFDGTTPPTIAAAGATGTLAFAARSNHTHTIGAGIVTRTMLEATGKNWQFLGQGTASGAVRTSTVTWTGTFKQLWFQYFIAGYSGSAIGRLIVGPTAGLSETATNHCCSLIEGVTLNTTSVSVPGWPTAVTAGAVARWGDMYVQNVAASVKNMHGEGGYGGTAATVVPTQMKFAGLMSDATNLINKAELAVYAAITGATISSTTFNAGTWLNVWGRNDD
jgi:hypothetical protein